MRKYLLLMPLTMLAAGCPVTQPQDTPVEQLRQIEPQTQRGYWLYVPSCYAADRDWPLVVTLHGTHGWDSSAAQIKEWKSLAEQQGFLVAAPDLRSVQGILPVLPGAWEQDLADDDKAILAMMDDVAARYRVDRKRVLLTGFSAGGYPLYYTGLRHPERFRMLIARACNSDIDLFEKIPLTDEVKKMPILIFWGKDDLSEIARQSWQAFRWLRYHKCYETRQMTTKGGHLRRPEIAWDQWQRQMGEEEGSRQ